MSEKEAGSVSGKLRQASRVACEALGIPQVGLPRLDAALFDAIDPQRLINNLAEAWSTTLEKARTFLEAAGFAAAIARLDCSTEVI